MLEQSQIEPLCGRYCTDMLCYVDMTRSDTCSRRLLHTVIMHHLPYSKHLTRIYNQPGKD